MTIGELVAPVYVRREEDGTETRMPCAVVAVACENCRRMTPYGETIGDPATGERHCLDCTGRAWSPRRDRDLARRSRSRRG
jgi:hypothetical protein